MLLSDFDYILPPDRIAQEPPLHRIDSKLMIVSDASTPIIHAHFKDLIDYLRPGDVLVLNDVRVIPARLYAHRAGGGRVEVMILDGWKGSSTRVLMRPARRIRVDEQLFFQEGWRLRVLRRIGQAFDVEFSGDGNFDRFLETQGATPLPPYIHRNPEDARKPIDAERYQTVFAQFAGAVAAPTAGLHFTHELLDRIRSKNIDVAFLTLFVGWGTFKPVVTDTITDHRMDEEFYRIGQAAADLIRTARGQRRIIAVGTTTTRALESWYLSDPDLGAVDLRSTDVFIYPGFHFNMIDALITNFHLPKSSLLMLVSAFAGRERILDAYRLAIESNYRFFSYGDAMALFGSDRESP